MMAQDMESEGITVINGRYALVPGPKAGGLADVYKAADLRAGGKSVAVKVLRQPLLGDDVVREAFRRETDALRECKHPNIVELLDAAIDSQTGKPFLVLEWIEQDLTDWLAHGPQSGWDTYFQSVGAPLLDALSFIHSRLLVHRDVTPSNILIATDGTPKLADFGISKLMRWTEPSITLNQFASRPYCPPEPDTGEYTYTRDVFGYAALTIGALSNRTLTYYEDLEVALRGCPAPDDICEILARCISTDPEARPAHAGILLAELTKVQQARACRDVLKTRLHIVVSGWGGPLG
jgi:serine/threonine protein kinase